MIESDNSEEARTIRAHQRQVLTEWFAKYTGPKPTITLTGLDERTDLNRAPDLDAELGILVSLTPEGRPRYPSLDWIETALDVCPRVALHICGGKARQALIRGDLGDLYSHPNVQRVQMNGQYEVKDVEAICHYLDDKKVITQHKHGNEHLLWVQATNHQVLLDESGGKGEEPADWYIPIRKREGPGTHHDNMRGKKDFGFAGGLSPVKLRDQLTMIIMNNRAEQHWFWVDMETSIRTNDWLDLDKCEAAVQTFQRFID